jgi:predicted acylesterase/phospholipase RssA
MSPRIPFPVAKGAYKAQIAPLAIVRQNALDAFEVWLNPTQHGRAMEKFLRDTEKAGDCDALIRAWRNCGLPEGEMFLRQRVFALAEGEKRWREGSDLVSGMDYVTGVRSAVTAFLKERSDGRPEALEAGRDHPPRIGLALSGGGSKGAFTVGALKVIRQELGITSFPIISGTSTGALIGTLLAVNDWSTLVDVYSNIRTENIVWPPIDLSKAKGLKAVALGAWVLLLGRRAIFETSSLEASIDANVDFPAVTRANTRLIYNTVDLQTGNVRLFDNKKDKADEIRKALLASSNMPVFTNPVKIPGQDTSDSHQYVDGGVREFLPLEAIYRSPVQLDQIVAISTAPLSARRVEEGYDRIAGILIRTIDLMETEIAKNDLRGSRHYNALLKMIREAPEGEMERAIPEEVMKKVKTKREIDVLLIEPDSHIDMDPLTFEPEKMQELMKVGMQAAKKAIRTLP